MKKTFSHLFLPLAAFCAMLELSAADWVCKTMTDQTGVRIFPEDKSCVIEISGLTDSAVRVQIQKQEEFTKLEEMVFIEQPKKSLSVSQNDSAVTVKLPGIQVAIDKKEGVMSFIGKDGKTLFRELPGTRKLPDGAGIAEFHMDSPKNEYLYGLGQFQDGAGNLRNLPRRLIQVNTQAVIPFLYSNRGFGMLWHNYSRTDFNPAETAVTLTKAGEGATSVVNVTTENGGRMERRRDNSLVGSFTVDAEGDYAFELDCGQTMARQHVIKIDGQEAITQRNMWLPPVVGFVRHLKAGAHTVEITKESNDRTSLKYRLDNNSTTFRSDKAYGIDFAVFAGNADEALTQFREVSGKVPLLPRYAFGYWHCRERYHNQQELLSNLQEFRTRKIPVDLIVQDWQWWDDGEWNSMHFDSRRFADPTGMNKAAHDMHARTMLSVWSKTGRGNPFGKEMQKVDGFIGRSEWIDFSKKEATDLYWDYFVKRLVSTGWDSWWLDAVEPENDALHREKIALGDGDTYRNVYPFLVNRTADTQLRKAVPNQRALVLTRCFFVGQQKYQNVLWTGDVGNSWMDFRTQILAGLHSCISGVPYWTTDTGGFFRPGNQYNDKEYHKRLVRWFEFSTFCPVLRVHGYTSNTELWRYGQEAENIFRKFLDVRYRLLPYVYSISRELTQESGAMMRPMIMDYPQDEKALQAETQYMFGPALLVCPVTEDKTEISVYLPKGIWYDFWTGEKFEGGKTITCSAPLDSIPVFVKAGSVLPIGPVQQYSDEKSLEELEIRIFPGADGTFTLYEDNGIDYAYEKGEFSEIRFNWADSQGKLQVAARKGTFGGMLKNRKFKVTRPDGSDFTTINYDGSAK